MEYPNLCARGLSILESTSPTQVVLHIRVWIQSQQLLECIRLRKALVEGVSETRLVYDRINVFPIRIHVVFDHVSLTFKK